MGGIPLAALAINSNQLQGPLDTATKATQLRALQQNQQYQAQAQPLELQERQQQVEMQKRQMADVDAATKAMNDWKSGDLADLPDLVRKHGGSFNAVMAAHKQVFDQKEQAAKIAEQDATTGSKLVETYQKKADQVSGELSGAKDIPDEQLHDWATGKITELSQSGLLDAPHAQQMLQGLQQTQNPAMIRQGLDHYSKSILGASALATQAQKQAETTKAAEETKKAAAETAKVQMETAQGGASDVMRYENQYLQAKGLPDTPANRVKAFDDYNQKTKIAPQQVRIEGYGKIRQFPVYDNQTKQTTYMDSNEINDAKLREPGRYTVPSFTPEAIIEKGTATAFAPGGKAGQELKAFNTATQHADLLLKAADALDNGDVKALNTAKNTLKTQFGSADVTNYQTIAKVYEHEVLKSLGGHVTDAEVKSAGAMIPDNASKAQTRGAVNNLKNLMDSKINVLRQQYEAGKGGQPSFPSPTAPAAGKPPDGATHIVPGPDGKKHYTNAAGTVDYGVVP